MRIPVTFAALTLCTVLCAADNAALVEDGIYTLQVGTTDAKAGNVLISAIVRNARKGTEVLARSPSATSV